MTTAATGNARLLNLAEKLESLPRKRFNYGDWVGSDWAGASDLSCGTTACALGWATTIPNFRALGLRLQPNNRLRRKDDDPTFGGTVVNIKKGLYDPLSAAEDLFGITYDEACFLFIPGHANRDWTVMAPDSTATPKQVARHIRRFVKQRERAAHKEAA